MSYVDSMAEFSSAQAVTATAISANVIDLFSTTIGGATSGLTPNTFLDVSADNLFINVSTAVTCTDTGSDATLVVTLESADNVALSTNPIVHVATGTLAFAAFAPAGTQILRIALPKGIYRRYLGVRYTVAAGPLTAGAFNAAINTGAIENQRYYKSGFIVQ
jgi:hypothetical protein